MPIEIRDLTSQDEKLFFCCLEDWSDEMKESGDHRSSWYHSMKDKGLGAKIALNDKGLVSGMIQYGPIEYAGIEGRDLYFIYCIWVHGHKQGIGDQRGRGLGKALLAAAEEDIKQRGSRGIVAWGLALPLWMKASWFKKNGFKRVDRDGLSVLLWKPFDQTVQPPKWIKSQEKPALVPGKVTVTATKNGWCSAANITYELAKRATEAMGEEVVWNEINTFDPAMQKKWGFGDKVFVQEKCITQGPPLTYEKIVKQIEKAKKKLKK